MTKYYKVGGLKRNLFSNSSGGWKSKIRVPAWWKFWWNLSFWLANSCLLALSSCDRERDNTLMSLLVDTKILSYPYPTLWPHVALTASFLKALSPNLVTSLIRTSTYGFVGQGRTHSIYSNKIATYSNNNFAMESQKSTHQSHTKFWRSLIWSLII